MSGIKVCHLAHYAQSYTGCEKTEGFFAQAAASAKLMELEEALWCVKGRSRHLQTRLNRD